MSTACARDTAFNPPPGTPRTREVQHEVVSACNNSTCGRHKKPRGYREDVTDGGYSTRALSESKVCWGGAWSDLRPNGRLEHNATRWLASRAKSYSFRCRVKSHLPWLAILAAHHILHVSRIRVKGYFNPLNGKLNPICYLLALLGTHHILHVSRVRIKGHFNPLNAKLNPICYLLALLGTHHILHVSRIRVKGHFNPLNAELNPICHLLALLGTHHILHVSRVRVNIP